MDKPPIKIMEYCGDPPYVLAKPEAAKVVGAILGSFSDGSMPIRLDFDNVQAISPSGARVLFAGLIRRYGREIADRLALSKVAPELVGILEDAYSDILQNALETPSDHPHKAAS